MAKKIRFPLKMKNGAEVRTLDELKENFDLESILGYFADGKLAKWLADRYYDEKAEAVTALTSTTPNLSVKLCEILEVEYQAENGNIDLESIKRHNKKYQLLSAITSKKEILHNIDIVAINQDDLYAILYDSPSLVYLYGEEFVAPIGAENVEYIGVNNPLVKLNKGKTILDYNEKGVRFKNVRFDFDVINYGETLFITGKLKEAFPVLKNAANNGNSRAMYLMAQYYSYGYDTVIIDEKERNNWYEKGYNLKDPASMYGYATNCIEYNSAEQKSVYNRIFNDIRNMAESGDVIASNVLGTMYKLGRGVEQNSVEAAKWYMVGAEQGYVNSQSSLGNLYYFGNGVDKDSEEAVKWYKKAAEQGNANAQRLLGFMYEYGNGISQNYAEAFNWYKRAVNQGNKRAKYGLAGMYWYGNGIEQNIPKAIDLFLEADASHNGDALRRIGDKFHDGDGVKVNYAEAIKWYEKAVEKENGDAQYNLGRMYYEGEGVTQNINKALELYKKADKNGSPFAESAIHMHETRIKYKTN